MNRTVLVAIVVLAFLASPAIAGYIVSAPSDLVAEPGTTINCPLTMAWDGVTGYNEEYGYSEEDITFCDVQVSFDPAVLQLAPEGVSVGTINPSWSVLPGPIGPGIMTIGSALDPYHSALHHPNGNILNALFTVPLDAPLGLTNVTLSDYDETGFTYVSGSINVVPEPSSSVLLLCVLAAGPVLLNRCNRRAVECR